MSILSIVFMLITFALSLYAQDEGTVTIITDPPGIEVWIGGKFFGETPVKTKSIPTGNHKLKLIDPIKQINIIENILIENESNTVVEKAFQTKFGKLKINSDPLGAQVYISTFLGTTPLENSHIIPGNYTLKIEHPSNNYTPVTEVISIEDEKLFEIESTLKKIRKFSHRTTWQVILGMGALSSLYWALIEQGDYTKNQALADVCKNQTNFIEANKYKKIADKSAIKRTTGLILGATCIVAFEVLAFF